MLSFIVLRATNAKDASRRIAILPANSTGGQLSKMASGLTNW
jgi:hypothetical protein